MSPRLPALRPREVIRAFERDGWIRDKQSGSHVSLKKPGTGAVIVVPVHNRDIPRGTLAGILRSAEISDERFIELLRS